MTPFLSRPVRIEWGDCDPAGIVFAPRYFDMLTENTIRLFEEAGLGRKRDMLAAQGILGYPLLDCSARFLRPCRYGDDVLVESAAPDFGRTSFTIDSRITLAGETCVEYREKRVWAAHDPERGIRSIPVPDEVRTAFAQP
jgi:4-hydroxybenzoyl-CoA thioesterase